MPKIKVNNSLQYTTEDHLEAPITGHEIRQPCRRHTVYKIYVHFSQKQGWFVYRRYREFHKLKNDLKKLFPAKEFTLPPKRYFGDNFEPRFLNSRRQGLQGFLYMITRQKDVQKSQPVAEFLSLDNPPSVFNDIDQCRAVIKQLEDTVARLKLAKSEHDSNLSSSNGQIVGLHDQKQAVLAALRYERQQNGRKYYPGDDLSLMFEYRTLPEVCRVDVSSFLVRKPPGYLARKFDDKTRREDTRTSLDQDHHGLARSRSVTPPLLELGRCDLHKDRQRDTTRKGPPYVEIQTPRAQDKKHFPSSDNVASPSNGEFQSFYDFKQRRKSMPGAVDFQRVNNLMKASSPVKSDQTPRPTSLVVPDGSRPRSFSAQHEGFESLSSHSVHPAINRVKKQISLESSKKNSGWSSLKDLRKLKGKI